MSRIAILLLVLIAAGVGVLVYEEFLSPSARLTWGAEYVCEYRTFHPSSWSGDHGYYLKARMPADVAARRIRALGLSCDADKGQLPPPRLMCSWDRDSLGSWWDPSTNFAGTRWDGEIGVQWFEMAKYENGWLYYVSRSQ